MSSSSSESEPEEGAPERDCDKTVTYKHRHHFVYEAGMTRIELPAYIQQKKLIVKAQPKRQTIAVKNI